MPLLAIEHLQPGMEVADDVNNVHGLLLLARGTILQDASIRVLKTWGVKALRIVGDEERLAAQAASLEPDAATWSEAEQALHARFQHVSEELRAARVVKRLATRRLAQHLTVRPPPPAG